MRTIADAQPYIDRWHLTDVLPVQNLSYNLVLYAKSPRGQVVLKLCDTETFETELGALQTLRGNVCKVLDFDIGGRAILLERLYPGTTLKQEPSRAKRLEVFLDLYKSLHIPPTDNTKYPTYRDWTSEAARKIRDRDDYAELRDNMQLADELCKELFAADPQRVLLHGDFHGDNILLGERGYTVIDPKGVVGPPVFDLPRFMLNEFGDEPDESLRLAVILEQIELFSRELGYSEEILRTVYFIEATIASSWSLEGKRDLPVEDVISARFACDLLDGRM